MGYQQSSMYSEVWYYLFVSYPPHLENGKIYSDARLDMLIVGDSNHRGVTFDHENGI